MDRSFVRRASVLAVLTFLSAGSSAALAQSAHWSGLYAGAHGGGSWGDASGTGETIGTAGAASLDLDGGLGGLHAGYNFATGGIVVGVEGDYTWTDAGGGARVVENDVAIRVSNSLDHLASLRGRLGVAMGPLLVYGTAGAAWTDYDLSAVATFAGGTASVSAGESAAGWVAGGGAEWNVLDLLSLRAEVLYYDFGSVDLLGTATDGAEVDGSVNVQETVVRGGISYHFN